MITINEVSHNGVKYTNYNIDSKIYDGIACYDDKRVVVPGSFSISVIEGSYKFGKQLQFKLHSPKGNLISIETRNFTEWNRIEVDMPLEDGIVLLESLLNDLKKKAYNKTHTILETKND